MPLYTITINIECDSKERAIELLNDAKDEVIDALDFDNGEDIISSRVDEM